MSLLLVLLFFLNCGLGSDVPIEKRWCNFLKFASKDFERLILGVFFWLVWAERLSEHFLSHVWFPSAHKLFWLFQNHTWPISTKLIIIKAFFGAGDKKSFKIVPIMTPRGYIGNILEYWWDDDCLTTCI